MSEYSHLVTREMDRLREDCNVFVQSNGALTSEVLRLRKVNADLLKALQQLVRDYEDVPEATDLDGQAVFEAARAAIAKASPPPA